MWSDLTSAYLASPDWIKALWLLLGSLVPPLFALGAMALTLHHRRAIVQLKHMRHTDDGPTLPVSFNRVIENQGSSSNQIPMLPKDPTRLKR